MSRGKNLRRTLAARRVETKSSPIPDTTDKSHWQRRFTWLVQIGLADPMSDELITPAQAGEDAKEIVRNEFSGKFPDEEIPSWMT